MSFACSPTILAEKLVTSSLTPWAELPRGTSDLPDFLGVRKASQRVQSHAANQAILAFAQPIARTPPCVPSLTNPRDDTDATASAPKTESASPRCRWLEPKGWLLGRVHAFSFAIQLESTCPFGWSERGNELE